MNLSSSLIKAFSTHAHEEISGGWFQEYLELLQDPAHILFEITITIVFDFIVIFLGYRLIIKKVIVPKLRRDIYREIDEEHRIAHHEHKIGETAEECITRHQAKEQDAE